VCFTHGSAFWSRNYRPWHSERHFAQHALSATLLLPHLSFHRGALPPLLPHMHHSFFTPGFSLTVPPIFYTPYHFGFFPPTTRRDIDRSVIDFCRSLPLVTPVDCTLSVSHVFSVITLNVSSLSLLLVYLELTYCLAGCEIHCWIALLNTTCISPPIPSVADGGAALFLCTCSFGVSTHLPRDDPDGVRPDLLPPGGQGHQCSRANVLFFRWIFPIGAS